MRKASIDVALAGQSSVVSMTALVQSEVGGSAGDPSLDFFLPSAFFLSYDQPSDCAVKSAVRS